MQYAFDFSPRQPGFADFVIGPANRQVVDLLQADAEWPGAWLSIVGPARCGRSRLAAIWVQQGAGTVFNPAEFNGAAWSELDHAAQGLLAIDDADAGLDDDRLLHVLNQARSAGGRVLLAAARPPVTWPAEQPDLVSRLKAMAVSSIGLPTDSMVRDLLEHRCHFHHVGLPEEVWTFLEKRIPRDYAAIEAMADELCAAVAGTGRGLTVPVAGRVLGETDGLGSDVEEADE